MTVSDLEKFRHFEAQQSESSKILKKMDELTKEVSGLREESRERQTLQFTIINLTPQILECSTKLKTIQELEELDLTEGRFSEVRSIKYPYPHNDVNYMPNIPFYTQKIKKLQDIHPTSIKHENGKVFYRDSKVLKVNQEGTVNKCFLKALGRTDETAAHTHHKFAGARPEDATFLQGILKDISDIHPAVWTSKQSWKRNAPPILLYVYAGRMLPKYHIRI